MYGLAGFMAMFLVFAVIRAIILGIVKLVKMAMGADEDEDDDE